MDTPAVAALRTVYVRLMRTGKAVLYAAFAMPILVCAAGVVGVMPMTLAADAIVPTTATVLALATAIGLLGQGVLKLIARVEVVEIMDHYRLTPGCLALTPEELAEEEQQVTPMGQAGRG